MNVTAPQAKVLIVDGMGINCGRETKHAFEKAGAQKDNVNRVHINDLAKKPEQLRNYNILMFPGGFSYGDHTGSGNALGKLITGNDALKAEIDTFVANNKNLVLGICNGFQVAVQLFKEKANDMLSKIGLAQNEKPGYIDRAVGLKVPDKARARSPWLKDLHELPCPVAHGEGRFVADEKTLDQLEQNGQVAVSYDTNATIQATGEEINPNGSMRNIAGVTNEQGNVLLMMPHPERNIDATHDHLYHLKKEEAARAGKSLAKDGPGLQLFKNAVEYVTAA